MLRSALTLLTASGLMALAATGGCVVTPEDEIDETETPGVAESALTICDGSLDCPPGDYVTQYTCGSLYQNGCGSGGPQCPDSNIRNMINCSDIPDGSSGEAIGNFLACGLDLDSTPYHYPNSYSYSSICSQNLYLSSTTAANRVYYAKYPGPDSSYHSCGLACRSGDHVLGYNYASQCRLDTSDSSTAYNRVGCKEVVNSSATVCGIVSCPSSKHYVSQYASAQSCSMTGEVPSEPNKTTCTVPTSTATWLYACGDSCPDGFTIQSSSYAASCRPSSSSPVGVNNRVYCVKS